MGPHSNPWIINKWAQTCHLKKYELAGLQLGEGFQLILTTHLDVLVNYNARVVESKFDRAASDEKRRESIYIGLG